MDLEPQTLSLKKRCRKDDDSAQLKTEWISIQCLEHAGFFFACGFGLLLLYLSGIPKETELHRCHIAPPRARKAASRPLGDPSVALDGFEARPSSLRGGKKNGVSCTKYVKMDYPQLNPPSTESPNVIFQPSVERSILLWWRIPCVKMCQSKTEKCRVSLSTFCSISHAIEWNLPMDPCRDRRIEMQKQHIDKHKDWQAYLQKLRTIIHCTTLTCTIGYGSACFLLYWPCSNLSSATNRQGRNYSGLLRTPQMQSFSVDNSSSRFFPLGSHS